MAIEVRQIEKERFEVAVELPSRPPIRHSKRHVYILAASDHYGGVINMSATGDVAPGEVESLIEGIQLAASLSSGRINLDAG